MFGTFLLPFRHLTFDHPWIDPVAPRLRALSLHFPKQAFVPGLKARGRRGLALGQPTFQDMETSGERQPIRVEVDRRRGVADYNLGCYYASHGRAADVPRDARL